MNDDSVLAVRNKYKKLQKSYLEQKNISRADIISWVDHLKD